MNSLEIDQSQSVGSPRTPRMDQDSGSGGCLFRFLCNPCFWGSGDKGDINATKEEKSSYYQTRVGKIRTRIARVLNTSRVGGNASSSDGNADIGITRCGSASSNGSGVSIDKESYLRWKQRKIEETKNSSENSDAATVIDDDGSDSSGSESSSSEDEEDEYSDDIMSRYPDPQHPARKFVFVLAKGMTLKAVVAMGRTKPVKLTSDGKVMQISYSNFTMTVPLEEVSSVKRGMSSSKLTRTFLKCDTERSFNIVLRGEQKAATFLARNALERDALVHGFQYLLTPVY